MGKREKKQPKKPEFNPEENDEFSIEEASEPSPTVQEKLASAKPIQNVFSDILGAAEEESRKPRKQKKIKKEALKLENNVSEPQQEAKPVARVDPCFKYVKNKILEQDLKARTLNGVIKVLNLISSHKKKKVAEEGEE